MTNSPLRASLAKDNQENWDMAIASLNRASEDFASLHEHASDEILAGYCNCQNAWLDAALKMPAPTNTALAEKLHLYHQHACYDLIDEINFIYLDTMKADAERLGGPAR